MKYCVFRDTYVWISEPVLDNVRIFEIFSCPGVWLVTGDYSEPGLKQIHPANYQTSHSNFTPSAPPIPSPPPP